MAIASSTGASARPRSMDPAIMAPALSCEFTTSHAPIPRIATWTKKRTNFVVASTRPPTSPERRKPSITVPFTAAQRSVMAGKMCMACTISALRIVASANSIASICLWLAVWLALRVAISFTMLNTNMTTAEESATNPSIGWRIQISATKMGTHGASKKAVNPCVAMKFWIWAISRRGWAPEKSPANCAGKVCRTQLFVQPATEADRDRCTQGVKRAHHGQRNGRDQREHDQRLHPAGGQHAVVDLQHVDRQGQHEHVDDEAEHRAHGESRATRPNGSLEFRRVARAPVSIGRFFRHDVSLARLEGARASELRGGSSSPTV